MIKANYINEFLLGIAIVLLLLVVCVAVDYADTNMTLVSDYNGTCGVKLNDTSKVIGLDESNSTFVAKSDDKIYTNKSKDKKLPIITMTGKPSCGCSGSYTWRTRTYINYCPNCHHWNCLGNKHKYCARFEQEITCYNCDSDFCINCGKEKYSYSRVYLRRA